jgi:hypothetical protein
MAIGLPSNLWRAEMPRREFIAGLGSAAAWPGGAATAPRAVAIWFLVGMSVDPEWRRS